MKISSVDTASHVRKGEDRTFISGSVFAVFDGHGGVEAADKCMNAMEKYVRVNGKAVTRRQLVDKAIADGHVVEVVNGKRRLLHPTEPGFWEEGDISKAAMDYAESLQRKATPKVETPSPVTSKPTGIKSNVRNGVKEYFYEDMPGLRSADKSKLPAMRAEADRLTVEADAHPYRKVKKTLSQEQYEWFDGQATERQAQAREMFGNDAATREMALVRISEDLLSGKLKPPKDLLTKAQETELDRLVGEAVNKPPYPDAETARKQLRSRVTSADKCMNSMSIMQTKLKGEGNVLIPIVGSLIRSTEGVNSGSTASLVYLAEDGGLHCAVIGDSPIILVYEKSHDISPCHNLSNIFERTAAKDRGGFVAKIGNHYYVGDSCNGNTALQMGRALGDADFGEVVSKEFDFYSPQTEGLVGIVICSDGLLDNGKEDDERLAPIVEIMRSPYANKAQLILDTIRDIHGFTDDASLIAIQVVQ